MRKNQQKYTTNKTMYKRQSKKSSSIDMIATSAVEESVHRVGRPYGGCAIVWNASISGKITKIESSNNRICGVLYTCDGSTILMIN